MKKTIQIVMVVNREDIMLKKNKMVLTKRPYKMYGITLERYISFTYSTVDNIPDDVLTAHVAVSAMRMLLEKTVLQVDQCFFSPLVLSIDCELFRYRCDSTGFGKYLLDPNYKDLIILLTYKFRFWSDNPVLADEHEVDNHNFVLSSYRCMEKKADLEFIIADVLLRHPFSLIDSSPEHLAKCREKYHRKQKVKRILKFSRSSPASSISAASTSVK